jgi:serine/threonine protein kinase
LAERLRAGSVGAIHESPLQLDDALPIARQFAEALECSHAKGIMHRNLKPADIKVTAEGAVKIYDFGLAKALDTAVAAVSDRRPVDGAQSAPLQDSRTATLKLLRTLLGALRSTERRAVLASPLSSGQVLRRLSSEFAGTPSSVSRILRGGSTGPMNGRSRHESLPTVVRRRRRWT